MRIQKPKILLAISSALCLSIGILIGFFLSKNPTAQAQIFKEVRTQGVKYTNPLLECETGNASEFKELIPFKSKVESVIKIQLQNTEIQHISLYFRDLTNGPWIGINHDELFSPASLLKVPLFMSILKELEHNESFKTKTFQYSSSVLSPEEQQTPVTLKEGTIYDLPDLINRMIMFSDNGAAHLLYNALDQKRIIEPYTFLELPPPFITSGEYHISVRKYAGFFRLLFNASYLAPETSEYALSVLAKTQYPHGLVAGVPKTLEVAHKYGERTMSDTKNNQLHDCGIIYYPNYPYILCIMTRGTNTQKLQETIALLSKTVFEEVDRQRKAIR